MLLHNVYFVPNKQSKIRQDKCMSDLAKKYLEEALSLPIEDRLELVDNLLKSLNTPTQKEIEELWAKEAERRVKEYDDGKVRSLNGEMVFKEIRDKYKK
jgi:putative addiction module component (TIGR02574 family)